MTDTISAGERLRAIMKKRKDCPVRRFIKRMAEVGHIRRGEDAIPLRGSGWRNNLNHNQQQ